MPVDRPDDATLRNLTAAMDLPPVDLIAISEGLWTWRTIDAELAELEQERELGAGVRSGDARRSYTFVLPDGVAIEATYLPSTSELVVDTGGGWATGVTLRQVGQTDQTGLPDEAGVCRFSGVEPGTSQLEIGRAQGMSIKTDAFGL